MRAEKGVLPWGKHVILSKDVAQGEAAEGE